MADRKFRVMDIETITNCFIACFEDLLSDERHLFVINRERNDIAELIKFLQENITNKDYHLGFNNISFDAQLMEFILQNKEQLLYGHADANEISSTLYDYAQYVIRKTNAKEFVDYPEFKLSIPVIDIFKLNHWDNKAKMSSLKWIQFSMDWHNVEEMPHPHDEPILDDTTLEEVISYCQNDVSSTKAIFNWRSKKGEKVMASQINLRAELSKTYGINLYSASETKISKEIFLYFLSNKLGVHKREIKDLRTLRENVVIRTIMLPYVKFETPEFNSMHQWFKGLIADTAILETESGLEKGPKHVMTYKGVQTVFGLGGLHGCIKSGIYEATPGKKILSADVTSYYPNLAIRNKWSPAHINAKDFNEQYEWFFETRKTYPKTNPLNYLFKIVLNASYGLSKNRFSFLYDPEFTFRITVNGQLLLAMLYEMIATRIPTAQPLMQNTDGLEFIVDDADEALFYQICKEWEEMTMLQLETVEYKKMIIGDVN